MKLILVGGFLGAGKTTLLAEAARRLASRGLRAGLITNDQAPELVDTALLTQENPGVEEVSGSCFCCNFPGLMNAMGKLRQGDVDVVVAEPVGSCTDLSATIVQPLKDLHASEWEIAPLSVLADPGRMTAILDGGHAGLHPSAAYIFRKQLEEADTIVVTKSDLLTEAQRDDLRARVARAYPLATVRLLSAQSGEGVDEWLEEVMTESRSGSHLVEVDYDTYAEGEAVLGWLNATYRLHGEETDWKAFAQRFLSELGHRFDRQGASVGHVKLMIEAGGDFVAGNLTGPVDTVTVRGNGKPSGHARMTLNARVEMSPETLEAIVQESLEQLADQGLRATPLASRCLSPGRPEPTYRYETVIQGS